MWLLGNLSNRSLTPSNAHQNKSQDIIRSGPMISVQVHHAMIKVIYHTYLVDYPYSNRIFCSSQSRPVNYWCSEIIKQHQWCKTKANNQHQGSIDSGFFWELDSIHFNKSVTINEWHFSIIDQFFLHLQHPFQQVIYLFFLTNYSTKNCFVWLCMSWTGILNTFYSFCSQYYDSCFA